MALTSPTVTQLCTLAKTRTGNDLQHAAGTSFQQFIATNWEQAERKWPTWAAANAAVVAAWPGSLMAAEPTAPAPPRPTPPPTPEPRHEPSPGTTPTHEEPTPKHEEPHETKPTKKNPRP
jgi:hypothetical protein